MESRLITALTGIVCLLLGSVSKAGTITISPRDDADVNSIEPDTVQNIYTLYTGGLSTEITRSYLKFNLSSIPEGQTIVSARLRLQPNSFTAVAPVIGAYYLENDNWSESTLTWNNAPTNFNLLPTDTQTISFNDAYWAVTGDVELAYGSDDIYSVILKLTDEGPGTPRRAGFWSKETEFWSPYLSIQYQPIPEPATLVLLGLGGLILRKRRA